MTRAADTLFTVREDYDRKLFGEDWDTAFHHSVVQLVFTSPRVRKYVQTSVAFLTIRVRSPDKDEWWKLILLLQYIISTIQIPLILIVDNMNIVKWWLDTSYAMHPDCRSHTGTMMSLGWGLVAIMSKRKNRFNDINGGVTDIRRRPRYFIEAQGIEVE